MVPEPIKIVIGVALVAGGIGIYIKADALSLVIKRFYSQYPVIRHAGDEQLSNRPIYLKFFGATVALLALVILFL